MGKQNVFKLFQLKEKKQAVDLWKEQTSASYNESNFSHIIDLKVAKQMTFQLCTYCFTAELMTKLGR